VRAISPNSLVFEGHTLDMHRCALLRQDEEIALRPKSFDVLCYLAEHAGRVVAKDELIEAVWAGISVTDDSVVQCIREVRQALRDEAHRLVKTVPRRGYVFTAEVNGHISTPQRIPARAREHAVTFCRTPDGVNIALSSAGEGMPLIRTANWFNHLEYEWENPLRAPLAQFLTDRCRLIRYDGRGNGLSDRQVSDLSFEAFLADLDAVADAVQLSSYALLGVSQGAAIAIAHAARHPERVSKLVLHGGFALGRKRRGSLDQAGIADATLGLMRHGWGDENSAFMRMFSALYMPHGTPEQIRWLAELQCNATSGDNAVRMLETWFEIDILDLLPKISAPTLVLHCRQDAAVPFEEGRRIAAAIPNSRLVVLESDNHLPMQGEPAWPKFLDEIEAFLAD
jgi:pimeloyl-ACP methyl ester carboxylesterase/DNA-binding winged helix-turn-helix (wHTH) protein